MVSPLFCPKCGRASEGGLCAQCFLERFALVECPPLKIMTCPICGSCLRSGKWVESDISDAVISLVKSQLTINPVAEDVHTTLEPEMLGENAINVHVRVDAMVKGENVSKEHDVIVRIKKESCDRCSRIAGGYYAAIVQVRAEGRFPTPEERLKSKKIAQDVIRRAQKSDRMAFISKVKELREGIDIYVGSAKVGKQISKRIVREFGGTFSESAKLVGHKDGKNQYRISYAVRLK